MQRIILLMQSGVGDLVMAIPLLRECVENLKEQDQLLILTESAQTELIIKQAVPIVPQITISYTNKIWGGSKLEQIKFALKLRSFHPTLFLLPHATDRFAISLFALLVGAKTTILPHSSLNRLLFHKTVKMRKEHKTKYYMRFGELGGLKLSKVINMDLDIDESHLNDTTKYMDGWKDDQKWIGLVPGSGIIEAHKRWSIENYQELCKRILNKGQEFRIAVLGSPSELDLVNKVKNGLGEYSSRVISVTEPDIMVTAGVIKRCSCIVVACSGLAHLAAALGTPVIGLYGPTNPGFTGPFFKKIRIVRAGVKCSPCYRAGFNQGCGKPLCMSLISAERVERELDLILKEEFTDIPWTPTCRTKPVKE